MRRVLNRPGGRARTFPVMPWMRTFAYLPATIMSREALRLRVCDRGRAMLLWPPQYLAEGGEVSKCTY